MTKVLLLNIQQASSNELHSLQTSNLEPQTSNLEPQTQGKIGERRRMAPKIRRREDKSWSDSDSAPVGQ